MADSQSKIDAAAEKAFAETAEKKTADAAKASVSAKTVEKAVEAGTTAPVRSTRSPKPSLRLQSRQRRKGFGQEGRCQEGRTEKGQAEESCRQDRR